MGDGSIDKLGINTVNVQSWGTGENDCWWNIAQNQLGESASAQEIQALVNQLQEYNKEKNASVVRQNDIVCEGDQIFIPLEYAMDEVQGNVESASTALSDAQTGVQEAGSTLTEKNSAVNSTLGALNSAQSAYDEAASQAEGDESVDLSSYETALNDAKEAYLAALSEQQQAQADYDKANEDLTTAKETLEQYKTELNDLQSELDEEEADYQTKLDEITKQIETIDTNIETTETELQSAKSAQEVATKQQEQAVEIGVKSETGEEGAVTYSLEDSDLDKEELASAASDSQRTQNNIAEIEGKEEKSHNIIDGGRTKRVEYEDGTVAEFHRDENGEWKATPGTVYTADGELVTGETDQDQEGEGAGEGGASDSEYAILAGNIASGASTELGEKKIGEFIENGETDKLMDLIQTYGDVNDGASLLGVYSDNAELQNSVIETLSKAYESAEDDETREQIAQILANDLHTGIVGAQTKSSHNQSYEPTNVMKAILDEGSAVSDELLLDIIGKYDEAAENEEYLYDLYNALKNKSGFGDYADIVMEKMSRTDTDMAAGYVADIESDKKGEDETNKLNEYFSQFDIAGVEAEADDYGMSHTVTADAGFDEILGSIDTSMSPEKARELLVKLYAEHGNSSDGVMSDLRNVHNTHDNATEEKYMQNYARLWVIASQDKEE